MYLLVIILVNVNLYILSYNLKDIVVNILSIFISHLHHIFNLLCSKGEIIEPSCLAFKCTSLHIAYSLFVKRCTIIFYIESIVHTIVLWSALDHNLVIGCKHKQNNVDKHEILL